ncbi:hypothetical protein MMC07_008778 [Pseudocyphellaria aurata]|nr:hypothetical protein [Pseudocyphellaria aurata]
MLPDVELLFHPNTIHCLAWSDDGELAIAAGEYVHILVPRRHGPGKNHGKSPSDPWRQVQFRINTFTVDEWPIQEPDCFDHFSIGEEQSTSVVTALAWSPPGLAMHKRSVLAVLTSNLVVSFWASVADPVVTASWQRVFVLNNAVKRSWERRCLSRSLPMPMENQLRRKLRVRSMSWAPRIRQWPEKYQHSVETKWGMFLLAVANDDGEVVFLSISSPYTTDSTSWDSNIVKSISLDERGSSGGGFAAKDAVVHESLNRESIPEPQRLDSKSSGRSIGIRHNRPSLFNSAVRRMSIDHLAWGPWKFNADAETILTFTRGGAVFHLWHSHIACDESYLAIAQIGQMDVSSWSNATSRLLPCIDGAFQVEPDVDRWSQRKDKSYPTTGHAWDQISGLTFCSDGNDQAAYLYLSTQLSHIEVAGLTIHQQSFQETALRWERMVQSTLHKQMLRLQSRYDRRNELGGLSYIKTWGLASLDRYVAACITLHPGDMPEYYIPSQERAFIVFSAHGFEDPSTKVESFSWDVDQDIEDGTEAQSTIIDTVFEYERLEIYLQSELGHKIIYGAIIASMLIWDEARSQRLLAAERVLLHLAQLVAIDLTPENNCLQYLLTTNLRAKEACETIKETTGSRSKDELASSAAQRLFDFCPFCSKVICWESLTEGYCVAGHQFARCSLTFLAIKEPAISKYCEGCDRPYFNNHIFDDSFGKHNPLTHGTQNGVASLVPTIEEVADIDIYDDNLRKIDKAGRNTSTGTINFDAITRKSSPLEKLLFDTFDICPYCGGKFIS